MQGRGRRMPLILGGVNASAITVGTTTVGIRVIHNNGDPFYITHLCVRWPSVAGVEYNTIQIKDTQHSRLIVDGSVILAALGRTTGTGTSVVGGGWDWFPLIDPVIIRSGQSLDCNISAVGATIPASQMCVLAYGYQIYMVPDSQQ